MICFVIGHKWRFNFLSVPNKGICMRCKKKIEYNYKNSTWEKTNKFSCETRTDKELIKKWRHNI